MFSLFVAAYVLGIVVAMPIGSVTIEAGRRAITSGFKPAFIFNLGSTSADLFYASAVYFGLAPLIANSEGFKLGLWIIGGAWLIWLGISAMRPSNHPHLNADSPAESPLKGYFSGVSVTLLNPLTILGWVSLAGNFFANWRGDWPAIESFGFIAIAVMLAGVMTWMVGLMGLLSSLRRFINPLALRAISLLAGLFLLGYGLRSWYVALDWLF